jgi:branched-chain amino acid transport system substrate-binding protein
MRLIHAATLALTLCAAGIGCKKDAGTSSSTGDIVIGEFASMTGGTAAFGTSSHDGLLLAVEQANNAGGVLGRRIKLVTADDRSDVNEAVTAVQKLINSDGAIAIIGEVASKRSLAGGAICQRYKIPMLSPASTNPAVTVEDGKVKPWVFRICFTDDFQGSADGKFAADKGWKRVAVLTDVDEDYSKGLSKFFKLAFASHGEIIADESYRNSDRDFQSQLTRIAEKHPDAIYIPGYYTELKLIATQAASIGLKVPLFGGDGWDSPETVASDATQGDFYSDHYSGDDPAPRVQDFIKTFQARFGENPGAMAVLGYDAGEVIIDAIKRSGKADPAAIRDALATTKDYPGVSGSITIDANHNARKSLVMLEIKDHAAHLVKTYTPDEVEK